MDSLQIFPIVPLELSPLPVVEPPVSLLRVVLPLSILPLSPPNRLPLSLLAIAPSLWPSANVLVDPPPPPPPAGPAQPSEANSSK